MTKNIFLGLVLALSLSCSKGEDTYKLGNGTIWLSGGLANCPNQIHLENGDTLIVTVEDIQSLTSGDKVTVKYRETGINKLCSPGIDCDIIEIEKAE